MSDKELKHCPFCGCSNINIFEHKGAGSKPYHYGDNVFSIGCYECGASVPPMNDKDRLIEFWNKRSTTAKYSKQTRFNFIKVETTKGQEPKDPFDIYGGQWFFKAP